MAEKKGVKRSSWNKKKWFKVIAPNIFGEEKVIAEIPAFKEDQVIGRIIEIPMVEVTKNFKHYKYKLYMKVKEVSNDKARTIYWGQELLRDVIARKVRKRTSRIDMIEDFVLKDNTQVRIKAIVITTRRVQTTLKSEIRKAMKEYFEKLTPKKNLNELITEILSETIQRGLLEHTKKLYPINYADIRKIEIL